MQRSKEIFWIILITAVLLFLSYAPVYNNYAKTPADRYYFGQSEYPLDMLGDLAYIEQGILGNNLASFNYSTVLGAHPSIVKMEYILIGRAGGLFYLSSIDTFLASRFIISLAVLAVLYYIIRKNFASRSARVISYVLVLFAQG